MNDETIASTCLARNVCRQHGIACSTACPLFNEIRYQRGLATIPSEYADVVVDRLPTAAEHSDTIRHFASVVAERKPKNGLFLTSATTGNGKTMSACAVANSFLVARARGAIRTGERIGQLVQFVNTVELLDMLRLAMNDESAAARAQRLIDRIAQAEMVVMDDIGAEKPTEWVAERFYSIINGIWMRRTKQTLIATSNKTLQALEMTLGARVRSRIEGLTITLEFVGSDKRRK